MKYVATAKRSKKFEGDTWTKQPNGTYTCPKMPDLKLQQWHMDSDLKNGYLKIIEEVPLVEDDEMGYPVVGPR